MDALTLPGRVVTFYSYKGGTGRSMALANVAWVLAAAGKSVLAIDWDLEAPGLHRYFKPFLIDQELADSDGLIDLIDRFACEAIRPLDKGEDLPPEWWSPLTDYEPYLLSIDFPHFPSGGRIDLLPAGRQGRTYAIKVNAFNWQNFYDRLGGGGFLEALKDRARKEYDYVLIDSRTGVSDTAGICTVQMPETLVVCFTYNNQSIRGACDIAASARAGHRAYSAERQRRAHSEHPQALSITPRPLRILPVPMRVDYAESDRLALRQAFAKDAFAEFLDQAVGDPSRYWPDVEVPHQAYYSYEEVLSPLKDDPHDRKRVLSSFVQIARHVSEDEVQEYRLALAPEQQQSYLEAFAETPLSPIQKRATAAALQETEEQTLQRQAESVVAALEDKPRKLALSVLARLARIEPDRYIAVKVGLLDFPEGQLEIIRLLAEREVVRISADRQLLGSGSATIDTTVSLFDDRLLSHWPRLRQWLAEDLQFLLWRQQLREFRAGWERVQDRAALLGGTLLSEAKRWMATRGEDLSRAELDFIQVSDAAAEAAELTTVLSAPQHAGAPESVPVASPLQRSNRRAALLGAFAAVALAVAVLPSVYLSRGATNAPPALAVPVPDVAGRDLAQARAALQTAGLNTITVDEANEEREFQAGAVVRQQPRAATLVPAGTTVRLFVTLHVVEVPRLIGLTIGDALKKLQERGLGMQAGPPEVTFDSSVPVGVVRTQEPGEGATIAPKANVAVRLFRQAPQVSVIGTFLPQERVDDWKNSFRQAGFALDVPAHAKPIAALAQAEVRYFDPSGVEEGNRILSLLKTSGIDAKLVAMQNGKHPEGVSYEVWLGSPLNGYRVEIFSYREDKLGGSVAQAIEKQLRSAGFRGAIGQRSEPAEYIDKLYPPQRFEVRYEKGTEDDAAAYLLSILRNVNGVQAPVLYKVTTSTPGYLSVFIPRLSS